LTPISSDVIARMRNSSVIIFSRVNDRTRAIMTTSETGLVRKSSAPASSPRTRSDGLSSAVTMITGMKWVFGSDFSDGKPQTVDVRHHHVKQNDVAFRAFTDFESLHSAICRHHVEVFGGQPRFEQLYVGENIVNDQNARGH
jgi:hypothetical protein